MYTAFVIRLSGSVYFSMIGLILSTLYYIFSPVDKAQLTDNGSMRQKFLILAAFISTVGSIVYLLQVWSSLVNIFMRDYDYDESRSASDGYVPLICQAPASAVSNTVQMGSGVAIIALFLGLICMY